MNKPLSRFTVFALLILIGSGCRPKVNRPAESDKPPSSTKITAGAIGPTSPTATGTPSPHGATDAATGASAAADGEPSRQTQMPASSPAKDSATMASATKDLPGNMSSNLPANATASARWPSQRPTLLPTLRAAQRPAQRAAWPRTTRPQPVVVRRAVARRRCPVPPWQLRLGAVNDW